MKERTFKAAGGCPQCGPLDTVFVIEPGRPATFSGDNGAFFSRHVGDARKPCNVCCPTAHAVWELERMIGADQ